MFAGSGSGEAEATERCACGNGRRGGTELFFFRRRLSFPRKPFCGSGDMKSARDELFDDARGAVDGEGATAGAGGACATGVGRVGEGEGWGTRARIAGARRERSRVRASAERLFSS